MATRSRVVVLNGASSAGNTTIATGFRDQPRPFRRFLLLTGIDDFLSKLPAEWKSAGPDHGTFAADGIRFERTSDGVRVRVGRVGRQLLRAYQAGVAATARVGLDAIVDEVVIDKTSWDDWTGRSLASTWLLVGIRCSAEVAEERSRVRGDRFVSPRRGSRRQPPTGRPDTTSRSTRRSERLTTQF